MPGPVSVPVNQTSNIFFLPQRGPPVGIESTMKNSIKWDYPTAQLRCSSNLPIRKKVIPNPIAITVYLFSFEGPFDFFLFISFGVSTLPRTLQ